MAVEGLGTNIIVATTEGTVTTQVVKISSVRWVGATASGHTARLADSSSNKIFYGMSNSTAYTDGWVYDGKWANGLQLTTIASGEVYIMLDTK